MCCERGARYMMFSLLRVRVSSLIAIGEETSKRQARHPPPPPLPFYRVILKICFKFVQRLNENSVRN